MRGLKTLVIVLGIVLLGGTVTLVAAIIWKGSHPAPPAGPPARAPGLAGQPFESSITLPPGAVIAAIEPAGERLVVHLVLQDGRRQLVIVDLRSGVRLGTIELQPAP